MVVAGASILAAGVAFTGFNSAMMGSSSSGLRTVTVAYLTSAATSVATSVNAAVVDIVTRRSIRTGPPQARG